MDRYSARMNLRGSTQRERELNRLKSDIVRKAPNSLSYKNIKLNGEPTQLMINTSTKPYYKEFESLPDQTVLAGDYVEWANSVWLVLNADCDDEVYTDGNLRQCQHKIFWQKSDGTIASRYAYTENASAYNNGEKENNTIILQSNQFMVYLPYDDETAELDNGKRVHMSRSNRKCKPYKLTRPDDITYGFGEKGVINIIFTQTQYNPDEDKLVTLEDGTQTWICNYIPISTPTPPQSSNPDETAVLNANISGNKNLKVGFSRTYTVNFTDESGNEIDWNDVGFSWNVMSDFDNELIEQTVSGNTIKLSVDDENLIGGSFILSVVMDTVTIAQIEVTITESN